VPILGALPPGTPVAFEAAYGWGWLVELLEELELEPHLVHPSRCKAIAAARLKNDKVDAATLAQLLRADLLPEAWIAPQATGDLRALLRHRAALVRLSTCLKNRVHAVLADRGISDRSGLWTAPGRAWLGLRGALLELVELVGEVHASSSACGGCRSDGYHSRITAHPHGCGIVGSSWCLGASRMRG
jgi:transposase